MKITKQNILQYCGLLGILGVLFYFLHILVGGLLYVGYNPVKQAISDLTAIGAPSELAARILSGIYGVFIMAFSICFYIFFRRKLNRIFSLGALFLLIMNVVSAIGYTAFPLSEAGFADTFQDTMHLVVTVLVVVLSIVALILLAIGFIKSKRYKIWGFIAIATLILMATGSILSGAAPAILGFAERISLYSLQIFTAILSLFMLRYKENA